MIFQKLGVFGRIQRESDQFLRIFRATKGVANPQALASAGSPYAHVYAAGYRELQSQMSPTPGNPTRAEKFASGGGEHAARVGGRSAARGKRDDVARDDGLGDAVHWIVRNGLGNH